MRSSDAAILEALQSAEVWMDEDGCDCGDEPGTCALCLVQAILEWERAWR